MCARNISFYQSNRMKKQLSILLELNCDMRSYISQYQNEKIKEKIIKEELLMGVYLFLNNFFKNIQVYPNSCLTFDFFFCVKTQVLYYNGFLSIPVVARVRYLAFILRIGGNYYASSFSTPLLLVLHSSALLSIQKYCIVPVVQNKTPIRLHTVTLLNGFDLLKKSIDNYLIDVMARTNPIYLCILANFHLTFKPHK